MMGALCWRRSELQFSTCLQPEAGPDFCPNLGAFAPAGVSRSLLGFPEQWQGKTRVDRVGEPVLD